MRKSNKKSLYTTGSVITLAIFLAVFVGFFVSGYRINSNFSIIKPGKIVVLSPLPKTKVLVDGGHYAVTQKTNEILTQTISSGIHVLSLSKDEFYPWQKAIEVKPNETITLKPFLIKKVYPKTEILEADPEYEKIKWDIMYATPKDITDKKISANENMSVWVEGNDIYAEWLKNKEVAPYRFCDDMPCEMARVVFQGKDEIRSLDFLPKRDDVLIMATQNGIYALEIDNRGMQNFAPIYEGVSPKFIVNKNNEILVEDNNKILKIEY